MGVLILNPNPVFDRTITVPELVPGAVIRTLDVELTAGGKGINVARVLRALGDDAPLIVPVGVDDHDRYCSLLAEEGADVSAIDVPGPVRVASIYLEQRVNRVTVVNDSGHDMSQRTWQSVLEHIRPLISSGDIVLCMGSFPPGLPVTALADVVHLVHECGAVILVDTAPALLRAGLSSGPDVVTPNLDEARATLEEAEAHVMDAHDLTGTEIRELATASAVALVQHGARRAIVTAGAEGAAMASGDAVTWLPAFPVTAVSTVGAGDSLVAGIAHVWMAQGRDVDWDRALAMGVSAAAASCEAVRAGGADPARLREIFGAVSAPEWSAVSA